MSVFRQVLVMAVVVFASPIASAEISKDACIDSHSRGQDAKDQGKLSLARKLFLSCAQSACPSAVQGDCARFADDLTRLQPSLSFVARDASGADLPDTTVYVDDVLFVTRLDDGMTHDVDPGKHVVRFNHHGKDQNVTVVVGSGEKGRSVVATFADVGVPSGATGRFDVREKEDTEPKIKRPTGAKVMITAGAILAIGGGALGVVGMLQVPDNCSLSTHQCAAPPGDPSFDEAASAVQLSNLGFIATGVGVAAVIGGFVWYYKGAKKPRTEEQLVAPWVSPDGAGIAVMGRL